MNIAILSYSSSSYKSNRLIIQAGKKRNHNVFVVNPNNLVLYLSEKEGVNRIYTNKNGILERLPKIDALIPRVASNVSHCASIIEFFTNNLGVYSTQSGESIRVCSSKWLTLLKANEFGIKVPKTIYCADYKSENLESQAETLGFPIILKENFSSQGKGLIQVTNLTTLINITETLNKNGKPFILQQKIHTKKRQHDFRTIVIGKTNCVVTMKKTVNSSKEWRTNLSKKGIAEQHQLTEEQRKFCIKVAHTIDSDVCGLDWMTDDNRNGECVLLENNSNFGTKIIDVTYNFFDDLFLHIEVAVEDFKKLKKQKDDKKKESNFLLGEIDAFRNELNKKSKVLSEILDNEKMRSLFEKCKGKELKYFDAESKQKEITIRHRKDIIHMMTNMLQIEN
jgi:RimK family alpha-L-glutamate ligase